jgi:hypothetical protein
MFIRTACTQAKGLVVPTLVAASVVTSVGWARLVRTSGSQARTSSSRVGSALPTLPLESAGPEAAAAVRLTDLAGSWVADKSLGSVPSFVIEVSQSQATVTVAPAKEAVLAKAYSSSVKVSAADSVGGLIVSTKVRTYVITILSLNALEMSMFTDFGSGDERPSYVVTNTFARKRAK